MKFLNKIGQVVDLVIITVFAIIAFFLWIVIQFLSWAYEYLIVHIILNRDKNKKVKDNDS